MSEKEQEIKGTVTEANNQQAVQQTAPIVPTLSTQDDDDFGGQVIQVNKPVYVGKTTLKVVAVNPSHEELKALLKDQDVAEPVYVSTVEGTGVRKTTIKIWCEFNNGKSHIPLTAFLIEEVYTGKNSGKTQFINNCGDTKWGFDVSDALQQVEQNRAKGFYMSAKTAPDTDYRKALKGEEAFINLFKRIQGVGKNEPWPLLPGTSLPNKKLYNNLVEEAFNGKFTRISKWLLTRNKVRDTDPDKAFEFIALLGATKTGHQGVFISSIWPVSRSAQFTSSIKDTLAKIPAKRNPQEEWGRMCFNRENFSKLELFSDSAKYFLDWEFSNQQKAAVGAANTPATNTDHSAHEGFVPQGADEFEADF